MTPTTHRSTRIALSAAASLAAVGALAACGSAQAGADSAADVPATEDGSTPADNSSSSSAGSTATTSVGSYADGTYEATGAYVSPGGQQQVDVSLTLADGIVTAVVVTPEAVDPRSQSFQEQFASGIEDVVVGVPLDELAVDVVSGSSLTSGGFNDAVEQIKAEALS
ncbi:FMN-binding protein [Salana multivorans]